MNPMNAYWTVKIGYQEHGATKWHPTEKEGPFSTLVRGAFRTRDEACAWASRELGPGNWEAVEVEGLAPEIVCEVVTRGRHSGQILERTVLRIEARPNVVIELREYPHPSGAIEAGSMRAILVRPGFQRTFQTLTDALEAAERVA